ncbi:MAG: MBL fold metallo-hydrolase, partial [Blastococcus sp.]|nr:MBL fold metallo-hydrolase [Blastococcus sp.]
MFDLQTIETSSLGDRSYLVDDGEVAIVIDPQRDIDRVLDLVAGRDVRITHVLETHVHNDYLTGGPELARQAGAAYVMPSGSDAEVDHIAVSDGEVIEAGRMRLKVLHTPGHTHHHVSYA